VTSGTYMSHLQRVFSSPLGCSCRCCMQHCTQYHLYTAVSRENAFWLVQRNRVTSRQMAAWRKSRLLLS